MGDLVVVLGDQRYAVVRPWGALPAEIEYGVVSHVAVDSGDNVYVFQRGDPPVVVFDADGAFVRAWGEQIADPHGIFITPDDLVVLVDRDGHQVMGFDPFGRLRFTLGEREQPRLQAPFNHPADVAVAPNGDIYVADGYANSAVHHFSSAGEWKQTWGRPGTGPGEFTTPHAIWVDRNERVLVADRENNRLQVFTADGEHIASWADHYHPMDIYVDVNGSIFVTDQIPRLSLLATDGRLLGRCRPVLYGARRVGRFTRQPLSRRSVANEPHHEARAASLAMLVIPTKEGSRLDVADVWGDTRFLCTFPRNDRACGVR